MVVFKNFFKGKAAQVHRVTRPGKVVRFLLTRTATWYIVVGGAFFLLVNQRAAVINRINYLRLYDFLLDAGDDPGNLRADDLRWGIRYYKKFQYIFPRESLNYANQAFCYFYYGNEKAAYKALIKATAVDPNWYFNHFDLGVIAMRQRKFVQAVDHFDQARKFLPRTVLSYLSLIRTPGPRDRDNIQKVIDGLCQQARNDEQTIVIKLAENYFLLKNYSKMLEYALGGAQNWPGQGEFFYLAGLGYHASGQYAQAVPFFDRAIQFNPNDMEAHAYRAGCYREIGQLRRAELDEEKVLGLKDQGIRSRDMINDGTRLHFHAKLIFLLLRQKMMEGSRDGS